MCYPNFTASKFVTISIFMKTKLDLFAVSLEFLMKTNSYYYSSSTYANSLISLFIGASTVHEHITNPI